MSETSRILLVTPETAEIQPESDRMTLLTRQPTQWSDVVNQLAGFTHLGVGPVAGAVAADRIGQTLDNADTETVSVFALPGYEWAEVLLDAPPLLSRFTPALDGLLFIAPASLIPEVEPPQWLPEAGRRLGGPLLDLLPSDAELELAPTDRPVAQPCTPFQLPSLDPSTSASESGTSVADARVRFAMCGSRSTLLMAGWLLVNDRLDDSHTLSQSAEGGPDADYWHAIMHRREPDYGNSKYWFRRVGRHPVFADLAPRAAEILHDAPPEIRSEWAAKLKVDTGWDSFAFVDMCQQAAVDEDSDLGLTARRIQWIEMLLLLRHCARTA